MYHVIINEQISKYLELYLDTTEPLVDILLHEPFEDGDSFLAQPDRVEHVVVEDRLEEIVLVVRLERGLTSHHLVHEDAKSPPGVGECGTHGVGNEKTQRRTNYQILSWERFER